MVSEATNLDMLDCAVCLQTCNHPTELPCGHIFCFLCVKGVANQSNRCAMCRQEIPYDFFKNPKILRVNEDVEETDDNDYQWYYEGRNGWWRYDSRTNKDLNIAYQSGVNSCELLIAGFLYIVDFESLQQFRRSDPLRRRKIKCETIAVPSKGIAGIRLRNRAKNAENLQQPALLPPSNDSLRHMRSLSLDTVMGLLEENLNIADNNVDSC